MAIKAVARVAPDWYTPEAEKGSENPTRFKLTPLDGVTYLTVLSEMRRNESGDFTLTKQGLMDVLNVGLTGWDNFEDENGKPIPFSRNNLGRVPPLILQELAGEILNRSEIGEDEGKN